VGVGQEKAQAILNILRSLYPQASTRLKFKNNFELLVAAILSSQTSDRQVNRVTERLFSRYPDAFALAQASPQEVEEIIKSLGLYRNKAGYLVAMAKILVEKYGGQVPDTREALMELPGVGRKVANVVLATGFGQDVMAVDTHVFRVTTRLGLVSAKNSKEAEEQLTALLPPGSRREAHHLLIYHGREVCKARKPECHRCPLRPYCRYYKEKASGEGPEARVFN